MNCIETLFNNEIKTNSYIKSCKPNTKKNDTSISTLINFTLSQSSCIKLGYGIEKVFSNVIAKHTGLKNKIYRFGKYNSETDHLFFDKQNKKIYYAEIKCNGNLDTEKTRATINKCKNIVKILKHKYPTYTISWGLVIMRYISNKTIPTNIKKKYTEISNNLLGVNEYLQLFGYTNLFNEESYKETLNKLAIEMFINNS